MSLRSNQLHLIGAIGYLLSVFLTMINLILMNSYYVNIATISVIFIFSMLSTCLVLIYLLAALSAVSGISSLASAWGACYYTSVHIIFFIKTGRSFFHMV